MARFLLFALIVGAFASDCRPRINDEKPLKGGDFEGGKNPFTTSDDNEFQSYNMVDNNLLEMYQDVYTSGGITYTCTYNWYFDNYYETTYKNGKTYVPYLRFYQNNDLIGNRYPTGEDQVGDWLSGSITFTTSEGGYDRIWIDAASPQPPTGEGSGDNALSIDNIQCVRQ
ncbi:hypothetical protein CEP52_007480 [Fusarium oligoseptatum]|uniref:Uncharacterized protein n=1 Tax=Fusarium oligoseptatum TaxID=2604345 RepID=A0A428TML7_9HYPO|nr:hypothetical protein CEP52_007480 [Fusarium oligoseptatum]